MAGNTALLKAETTLAWISQFDPADQSTAGDLLREMTLVSRDEFAERLRALILKRVSAGAGPVGLYAERERGHRFGVPHRLFRESKGKVKRAEGAGPQPVQPTKAYMLDVGSEGLVAQLISELQREFPKLILSHPSPDQIRGKKVRRFIVVTDFIGSGKRGRDYIQAAWLVRSVRSWWSRRKTKGLSFEVVAYAATPVGKAVVERHPSRPAVNLVTTCPTLDDIRGKDRRNGIRALCYKYAPVKPSEASAYGFGGVGALIAFAHGVPNNAPLILHMRRKWWTPLFPARVTSATRVYFTSESNPEIVRDRLSKLGQLRLAKGTWVTTATPGTRKLLLTLAALSHPPRTLESISGKTGLTTIEVEEALSRALAQGWVNGRNVLTEAGQAELKKARKAQPVSEPLPLEPAAFYYPQLLRAPVGKFS